MFIVTILGVPTTALSAAIAANDISGLDPQVIKDSYQMDELPYPGQYFRVDDNVFSAGYTVHKAGSDKVKLFIALPDPVLPPVADFTIQVPGSPIVVGNFAVFGYIQDIGAPVPDSYTWSAAKDGDPLVQIATGITSGKFFPPTPGSYTISLTVEGVGGSDTETKVGYLVATV